MTDSLSSPPLPTHEDMPGTVTNVARTEHLSCSVQPPLWTVDILMDKLDKVSPNLTPSCSLVCSVLPSSLQMAACTGPGSLRTEMGEQTISVFYID